MAKPTGKSGFQDLFTGALDPILKGIEDLGDKLGTLSFQMVSQFITPLKGLGALGGSAVSAFVKPLEGLNSAIQRPLLDVVGGMKGAATAAFLPLSAGLATFAAASGETIQQLKAMAGKANPGAVFQFDRALDDLAGTLGQILTPVLNGVTGFVREVADVFQGLRPAIAPIMGGIQQVIGLLASLIEPLGKLLAPVMGILGAIISNVVVPVVSLLVEGLKLLADAITFVLNTITLGLVDMNYQRASSQGAAVRPASYGKGGSGILEIGQRSTLRALEAGRAPELTPDGKSITKEQQRTNELLARILGVSAKTQGPQPQPQAPAVKRVNDISVTGGNPAQMFALWLTRQVNDR